MSVSNKIVFFIFGLCIDFLHKRTIFIFQYQWEKAQMLRDFSVSNTRQITVSAFKKQEQCIIVTLNRRIVDDSRALIHN